jgi:hypothetical protein
MRVGKCKRAACAVDRLARYSTPPTTGAAIRGP